MSAPSAWKIEQVMSIAMATRDRLLKDDPQLASDEAALMAALNGEGVEAEALIDRMIRAAIEVEAMEAALKTRIAELTTRASRLQREAQAWRGAAFSAMDALGITSRKTGDFTASIRVGRPSTIITDETALPDEYFHVTRVPDKKHIGDDLAVGVVIPGAELANGIPTLAIRKG